MAAHCDASESWQVDESEIGAILGVHVEDDRLVDDTLVLPADLVGEIFDGRFDVAEVGEFLAWYFIEEGKRLL